MAQAAAASHAARLAELNVAPEVIAAVPGCTREPPVTGGVRVMSWNILAEGMSYDGFHVRDVLAPDEEGSPAADTFMQLFGELTAAKADGNPDAMKALKARLETARSSNSAPRRSPSSASASAAFADAKATPSARNLAKLGEDPRAFPFPAPARDATDGFPPASLNPCALCRYASRAAAQSPDCANAFAR